MSPTHLLFVAFPAWGHTRPLCALAARFVAAKESDIVITILSLPNILPRIKPEISRHFPLEASDRLLARIRVVSVFDTSESDLFKLFLPYIESYPAAYQTLANGASITCATTGVVFDAIPGPVAVVMDFFCFPQLQATRAINAEMGRTIPIFSLATGAISLALKAFGPVRMGGPGNLVEFIAKEAQKLGKTAEEAGDEIINRMDGKVINVPGIPSMYDYEHLPQELPFDVPKAAMYMGIYSMFVECDGTIVVSNDAYESIPLDALRSWFKDDLNKPVYTLGPLLPLHVEERLVDAELVFKGFLDAKLAEFGEGSVLFMSFGTVFRPKNSKYTEEVVEAFLEKQWPFILCTASPFMKISPALEEKVKVSGIGMLSSWTPQQYILSHPATGWFLTHGGFGSVTEALSNGVPMICWPFEADQPITAAHLTVNLGVAFELIQVRTGVHGLKPLHPSRGYPTPEGTLEAAGREIREIIDKVRGPEGKKCRENAQKIKGEFRKAWDEDGNATQELKALMNSLVGV